MNINLVKFFSPVYYTSPQRSLHSHVTRFFTILIRTVVAFRALLTTAPLCFASSRLCYYNKSVKKLISSVVQRNDDKRNLNFKKYFLWKIVFQRIFLHTLSIGFHRNANKKIKPKIQKRFCLKDRFYIKIIWRSYQFWEDRKPMARFAFKFIQTL